MQGMQKTQVRSLGQGDSLEEGMATHSSVLAWRIPWTGSLVGCSPWGRTEWDMNPEKDAVSEVGVLSEYPEMPR